MGESGSERGDVAAKPEPDEEDKKQAAEMMTAYEYRPTLVLPGTGGAVSGTAVGEWLDADGNSKYGEASGEDQGEEQAAKEQTAKDKEFNAAVLKAAKARGSDGETG
jgi:hypothetical protein